jgi:tripartite-type tricarboxylate transporter receptor subunit TctC
MKLLRRQFLRLSAGAAALPAVSRIARAQTYPTRPVRIVVPSGAGGTPDIYARLVGPWLSVRLGQSFVIENRAGGSGNIGTEVVVRAAPDGYTLLLVTPNNAINVTLYDKLNFNFSRDIAPVASITRQSEVMLVNPSLPAKTLPEFIAYAKAHPGKISMASAGTGTPPHLAGELLNKMAGIDMVHIPYRGGASAMTDLIGGQVQVQFTTTISSMEHIRSRLVRALAVTTAMRFEALPDVPTIGEFVPGYETSGVFGVGAPRNTAAEIIDKLNKEINAALADPTIKARLTDLGGTVIPGSPTDYAKLIAEEIDKWGAAVKFSDAKPD